MTRISWEEYALELAEVASKRSEDPFLRVGAVALREDNSVISLGFNGAPPGKTIDWSNRDERRKRVCHAELACLRYCIPGEVKLLAVTLCPCSECIKQIAMYKISRVVFRDYYDKDDFAPKLAKEFGIELIQINNFITQPQKETLDSAPYYEFEFNYN